MSGICFKKYEGREIRYSQESSGGGDRAETTGYKSVIVKGDGDTGSPLFWSMFETPGSTNIKGQVNFKKRY